MMRMEESSQTAAFDCYRYAVVLPWLCGKRTKDKHGMEWHRKAMGG
jgi:hypothetical protein